MRKTRLFLIALLIVVLAVTFVACDNQKDKNKTDNKNNMGQTEQPEQPGQATKQYIREGNTILFGTYPQSKVTDGAVTTELDKLAGALPMENEHGEWTSYRYYQAGAATDYMWYIDVDFSGERYRGVYFDKFRPYYFGGGENYASSNQQINGYVRNTAYWFKYEPIKWRILEEKNGRAFLFADVAIDAQAFQDTYRVVTEGNNEVLYNNNKGAPYKTYTNNYQYSSIRIWLNQTFYATAFNDMQKELIEKITVDNSLISTGDKANDFICEDTQDKVFLLSYYEASQIISTNSERQRKSTDYAKSQGVKVNENDYTSWRLRTPFNSNTDTCIIKYRNDETLTKIAEEARFMLNGIVPALWIRL